MRVRRPNMADILLRSQNSEARYSSAASQVSWWASQEVVRFLFQPFSCPINTSKKPVEVGLFGSQLHQAARMEHEVDDVHFRRREAPNGCFRRRSQELHLIPSPAVISSDQSTANADSVRESLWEDENTIQSDMAAGERILTSKSPGLKGKHRSLVKKCVVCSSRFCRTPKPPCRSWGPGKGWEVSFIFFFPYIYTVFHVFTLYCISARLTRGLNNSWALYQPTSVCCAVMRQWGTEWRP